MVRFSVTGDPDQEHDHQGDDDAATSNMAASIGPFQPTYGAEIVFPPRAYWTLWVDTLLSPIAWILDNCQLPGNGGPCSCCSGRAGSGRFPVRFWRTLNPRVGRLGRAQIRVLVQAPAWRPRPRREVVRRRSGTREGVVYTGLHNAGEIVETASEASTWCALDPLRRPQTLFPRILDLIRENGGRFS